MKIFIVIPCYNEEAVLPKTLEVLGNLIKTIKVKTDADTELLLVDDGSRDRTWQMISEAAKEHKYVHGIKLSHNRGIRMPSGQEWRWLWIIVMRW